MKKEKWVPKEGDRCFAYNDGVRRKGIIRTVYSDNTMDVRLDYKYNELCAESNYHRNQLRPIKPPKPKREKIVAFANIFSNGIIELWRNKKYADDCAGNRIRCVRLEEVSDEK